MEWGSGSGERGFVNRGSERFKHRHGNDHLYTTNRLRHYYHSKCKRRADRHQRGSNCMRGNNNYPERWRERRHMEQQPSDDCLNRFAERSGSGRCAGNNYDYLLTRGGLYSN